MAGLGRKVFAAGEVLTAANVGGYLMDQSVMVFADAASRTSALGLDVSEGMVAYTKDDNAIQYYNGSAWESIDTLPAQAGQANKYLTTNGTTPSWAAIVTDPNPQIFMMMGA